MTDIKKTNRNKKKRQIRQTKTKSIDTYKRTNCNKKTCIKKKLRNKKKQINGNIPPCTYKLKQVEEMT